MIGRPGGRYSYCGQPRTRGGRGVRKSLFLADVLCEWPLSGLATNRYTYMYYTLLSDYLGEVRQKSHRGEPWQCAWRVRRQTHGLHK